MCAVSSLSTGDIDPYGQSFFPNCISAWNGLAKDIAEANTLDIFKSKLPN